MSPTQRPRVLCVDDEPRVLEGLELHLRRRFEVLTAASGAEGLELIRRVGEVAVIVSDMRMPGMDGAEFLGQSRRLSPDSGRLLLTGQADLDSAMAAVNDGHIFQFLTKPCRPERLLDAVGRAAEQYRLVQAERSLLEETLAGSIRTVTEVLSIASPAAFGRAARLKRLAAELCGALGVTDRWHVELAAELSQLGCIALPPAVAEKLHLGRALGAAEQAMVDRIPAVSEQLLAHIPRLEPVRAAIAGQRRRYDGLDGGPIEVAGEDLPLGARVLRLVVDFDTLELSGMPAAEAMGALAQRAGVYDPRLLEALGRLHGTAVEALQARDIPLADLRPRMVFAEDLRTRAGMLLVAHGHAVSHGLLERIRNMDPGAVRDPVRVLAG